MSRLVGIVLVLLVAVATASGTLAQEPEPAALAEIVNTEGEIVGVATFRSVEGGAVQIDVEISNWPEAAGEHGIHIHEVGQCTPDFQAAGGHFNPTGAEHGRLNPEGPHAGDLPNIQIMPDGTANYEVTTERLTLTPGPTSIFDEDGAAIVIHAQPDDHFTDPSGNSGDRIACGVIYPVALAEAPAEAAGEEAEATPELSEELLVEVTETPGVEAEETPEGAEQAAAPEATATAEPVEEATAEAAEQAAAPAEPVEEATPAEAAEMVEITPTEEVAAEAKEEAAAPAPQAPSPEATPQGLMPATGDAGNAGGSIRSLVLIVAGLVALDVAVFLLWRRERARR